MAKAKQLLCPNCDAPLPVVTLQTRTECAYCGRRLILEPPAPVPPPAPYPPLSRPRAAAKTASLTTVLIILVVAGGGIGMALFIRSTINGQIDRQRQARADVQQQMEEARRSMETIGATLDTPAFKDLTEDIAAAKREAEQAVERATARRDRAEVVAKRSRAKKAKPLPEKVDDAVVERALNKLDVSHCPGPGFVVYTLRADSAGRLVTVSQGPMHVSGGTFGCIGKVVDQAKKTVRFPKTQHGSGPVKRRLEAPAPGGQGSDPAP